MSNVEIVIKIPEEIYQKIKETSRFISGRRSGGRIDSILFNAVNTDTLLPKGHGKIGDLDKARCNMLYFHDIGAEIETYGTKEVINNIFKDVQVIIGADKEQEDRNDD